MQRPPRVGGPRQPRNFQQHERKGSVKEMIMELERRGSQSSAGSEEIEVLPPKRQRRESERTRLGMARKPTIYIANPDDAS